MRVIIILIILVIINIHHHHHHDKKSLLRGIYYCLTLCVTTFTTVMGVLVLQMHFNGRSGQKVNIRVRGYGGEGPPHYPH